jgi:hypothetical protein
MHENTSRQLPITNYRLPILNLLSFFCHLSGSKIDGKTFSFTARVWLSHVLPLLLLASSISVAKQYIGNLGKTDNGIVSVNADAVVDHITYPLRLKIFKPRSRLQPGDVYSSSK